jgi:peptide/nickel transport system permease protein
MRELVDSLRANRKAMIGVVIVGAFFAVGLVGPWLFPHADAFVGTPHAPPSAAHWLGTTGQGQDVLAQAVAGARTTLWVGLLVGLCVTGVGTVVGVTSAFFGGRTDDALSLLTNVFLVLPGLPLAIVLAAWLPPGPLSIAAVLSVAGWAWNARVFRAQAMSIRRRDFVDAAIVAGESPWRIIVHEILPNMSSLIVAALIGATVYAIGAQVGLEFLGLGDVGAVTWGTNLYWAANDSALLTGSWWIFVPTGFGIAMVGFGLTLVNFGIDEVTNPRLRARAEGSRARSVPAGGPSTEARLEVRDLTIEFLGSEGTTRAVDGVSFTLKPGEILGLAGESGSGKSTIAKALMGLLPETGYVRSGAAWLDGVDVLGLEASEHRRLRLARMGMAFQSALNALNPVLTVRAQMADGMLAHRTMTDAAVDARIALLLTRVGLDPTIANAYPHQLSGGMRQRVVIAMAMSLDPSVLILDEPTTALDVVVQREILQRINALREELGFSVILITHDMPLLLCWADTICVLQRGRVLDLGSPSALQSGDVHPYTQQLLDAFVEPDHKVARVGGAS